MASVTTVGDRIKLTHNSKELVGEVQFIGDLKSRAGVFYGIALDQPNTGDNNGTASGTFYFSTSPKKGIFIREKGIVKTNASKNTRPRVTVNSKVHVAECSCDGTIRFIGALDSKTKATIHYGIELDQPNGTPNSEKQGTRLLYKCKPKHFILLSNTSKFTALQTNTATPYKIKPKAKKRTSSKKKLSTIATPTKTPNKTSSFSNKLSEMKLVSEVLNNTTSSDKLTTLIESYDDQKDTTDLQWLQVISTFKTVYDRNQHTSDTTQSNASKEADYLSQIASLESQISSLKTTQNQSAPNNSPNIDRKLKFELAEVRQQYESQIKTLSLDKQRLQQQLASAGISIAVKKSATPEPDAKSSEPLNLEKERKEHAKIAGEYEQMKLVVRAKDEIIDNAKLEIEKLRKTVAEMREEEQKAEVQLDPMQKDRARNLLQQRVDDQQRNSMINASAAGIDLSDKKTISEMLNDCGVEDAVDIIHSMGVVAFEWDRKLKRDTYDLNLTNNGVLKRLTNDQRKKWMMLLAHCICDKSGGQKIEKIKMSNMTIDDKLFPEFMDILIENIEHFAAEEWWLESNKIGNEGMKKFAQFVGMTPGKLEIVKMYNNKLPVSTQVLNELLAGIEANDVMQKFTFEWRLMQHRDRLEKHLKQNQDVKRKRKWKGK